MGDMNLDKLKEAAEKATPLGGEPTLLVRSTTILALIERVEIAEADLRLVLRADVTRLKAAETAYREESA